MSGSPLEQSRYLAFDPYEKRPPGTYEVEFKLTGRVLDPVTVDVYAAPDMIEA